MNADLGVYATLFPGIPRSYLFGFRVCSFLLVTGFQIETLINDWRRARHISYLTVWSFIVFNVYLGLAIVATWKAYRAGILDIKSGGPFWGVSSSHHTGHNSDNNHGNGSINNNGNINAGRSDATRGNTNAFGGDTNAEMQRKLRDFEKNKLVGVTYIFHVLTSTLNPVIALLYWTMVYESGKSITASSLVMHGFNAVISLVDYFISASFVQVKRTLPWVATYSLSYIIFTAFMFAADKPAIYKSLDWEKTGTIVTLLLAAFVIGLIFTLIWLWGKWKVKRMTKMIASIAPENVPLSPIGSRSGVITAVGDDGAGTIRVENGKNIADTGSNPFNSDDADTNNENSAAIAGANSSQSQRSNALNSSIDSRTGTSSSYTYTSNSSSYY